MLKRSQYFLIAAALLFIFAAKSFAADAKPNTSQELGRLMSLSNQLMGADKTVILKHSGLYKTYAGEDDFQKLGSRLSRYFQLPAAVTQLDDNGHLVYLTTMTAPNGLQTSLRLVGLDDHHSTYMILTVKAETESAISATEPMKKLLEKRLSSLDLPAKWNTMVQGELSTGLQQERQKVWTMLDKQLKAKEVERYHDENTVSVSFYSSELGASITSGNHMMNLQAALHRNSVTDKWRLTLGTPIITIEY